MTWRHPIGAAISDSTRGTHGMMNRMRTALISLSLIALVAGTASAQIDDAVVREQQAANARAAQRPLECAATKAATAIGEHLLTAALGELLAGALDDEKAGPPAGAGVVAAATLGRATSFNYTDTFFKAYPHLEGKVVVHHAVPQAVWRRWPNVISQAELHSLENLRGIPKAINSTLHLSSIQIEWNSFYKPFIASNTAPTRAQVLAKATAIDAKYGTRFNPPRC